MNPPDSSAPNATAAPFLVDHAAEEPVVQASGLCHTYGEGEGAKQVLFDNDLTIYPGEIVIMTGPSGSGKTTLLTLIGALRSVQKGSLHVLGRELHGLSTAEQVRVRRDIGFIFQAHNLFDSLTAYQNVRLTTELHEYTPEQRHQLPVNMLAQLGLAERMHYRPANLSGGQRQRVAIGRALVNQPKLVLADEPTAALDKDTGRQVVTLLQKMAKEQRSAIMIVTHDNRILDVADRIVNMVDGYIVSNVEVAENIAICKFLQRCSVFEGASPNLLAEIAGKMKRETHPAGKTIIRQGDPGDKFYIVRRGRVEVSKQIGDRSESLVHLGAGAFFGELALLRDEPRAATVASTEPVELLTLSKSEFLDVRRNLGSFEEQLRKANFGR
ncbi:ATP-binding cassette domain-containing protein [Opitutus sp. ER46]|uniref:ATP-binding cassette domain-containing protein n=1 Tax=Opitutus sp. ER46 TaxID=2161864 RepID=UPI001304AD82|nr:ATP-binding cassette domain-containing protein [Opitutus sp. ER46]